MVLDGEDDGKRRGDKGALCNGLDNVPERDLGGEGMAVVDDGGTVIPVPTVKLHAATASQKNLEKGGKNDTTTQSILYDKNENKIRNLSHESSFLYALWTVNFHCHLAKKKKT